MFHEKAVLENLEKRPGEHLLFFRTKYIFKNLYI